ncbi:TPA: EpsG family protein, partial [Enterobacter hormaechei subsp. steigerwaltii]|nr:EpsG family protein [Enterobacter hormaechei subsp. steigerwaltii]
SVAYSNFVLDFKGLNSIDFMDKEPGFWLLLSINHLLFDNNVTSFLLLYAFISISIKIITFKKLSSSPILTVILYVSTYFILHDMNQIRIGLACAIILWSLKDVIERNKSAFLIKIIIAILFHYSAIIALVIYLFDTKKINKFIYFFAPLFCSVFLISKNLIFDYSVLMASYLPSFLAAKVNTYVILQQQGVFDAENLLIMNVGGAVLFIILVFFIIYSPKVAETPHDKLQILLTKVLSLQLVLGELFAFNSELSNRFFTLFGFLTIPLLLPSLKRYITPGFIATLLILLYSARQLYSSITGVFLF